MLERELGPQATAAITLFGERVDAARAMELGLVWSSVADDELLDRAVKLAAAGAALSRDLAASVKATLREAPWQPDFESAVQTELDRQKVTFARGGGS